MVALHVDVLRDIAWLRVRFEGAGPEVKSDVKKIDAFLFASMVSFSLLSLNTLQISLLIFSISLGEILNALKPSSWYKPMSFLYAVGKCESR